MFCFNIHYVLLHEYYVTLFIIIIIIIIITLQPYKNILIQQMRISERRKWLTVNIT